MKIILLANHVYAIPAISFLASKQLLQAVVIPEAVQQYNLQVENTAKANNILVKRVAKNNLGNSFKDWLTLQAPDLVIAYTFSYKITKKGWIQMDSPQILIFFQIHFLKSLLDTHRHNTFPNLFYKFPELF